MQAVVMGMSASGVIIGILRLITKGAFVGANSGLRISTQVHAARCQVASTLQLTQLSAILVVSLMQASCATAMASALTMCLCHRFAATTAPFTAPDLLCLCRLHHKLLLDAVSVCDAAPRRGRLLQRKASG